VEGLDVVCQELELVAVAVILLCPFQVHADLGQFLGVVTFDEKDATCEFLGLVGILGLSRRSL
jgi:hypothetical protein